MANPLQAILQAILQVLGMSRGPLCFYLPSLAELRALQPTTGHLCPGICLHDLCSGRIRPCHQQSILGSSHKSHTVPRCPSIAQWKVYGARMSRPLPPVNNTAHPSCICEDPECHILLILPRPPVVVSVAFLYYPRWMLKEWVAVPLPLDIGASVVIK